MDIETLFKKFEEQKTIIGNYQGYGIWWEDVRGIFDELATEVVKIPLFAEDVIKVGKAANLSLFWAMDGNGKTKSFCDWIEKPENQETFARAWNEGYEVKEENSNPLFEVEEDGTIKKGCRFKRLSNRALRLVNRRRKAYRSLSEERKKLQGQLINHLVSTASIIKMEELNVKGLQKRAKDIRINPKTNRPFSKKRFGKSIFRAAPSAFREALKTRAAQLGIKIIMILPKDVKPSQYNHILQTFEKKPLSTRIFDLSPEWTGLQRDLYSAFLIGHIENGHYQETTLNQDFPGFYQLMKDFLQQTPKTSRLAWYFS